MAKKSANAPLPTGYAQGASPGTPGVLNGIGSTGPTGAQPSGTQNFGGGGGGGKKSAPPPPDYYGAAQATSQGAQNVANQITQANRPNQQTGFGSEQWIRGPNGQWTQITSLNPELGGALGGLQAQAYNNSMNGPQDIAQARNQAIASNYNQAASRLNPQWQMSNEQLGAQLANQGLDPNSAAYRAAMMQQSQAQNDAYQSAINNAIGMGNQTEATQLGAQLAPYQQMQALQGFQNGLPGFNAATPWQSPNYLGAAQAAGNYGLQGQQQTNQAQGDVWSGVGQLASTAAEAYAASDERIKTDIKRLPVEAAPGIPAATFRYKHDPSKKHHFGVIAQDVEKVAPQHVHTGPDGIKRVDYAGVLNKPFEFK